MNFQPSPSLSVGKYLLSPSTRQTATGHYAASISIRSGRGTSTHDRVFRFAPAFACAQDALDYALRQGLGLVRQGPSVA